MTYQGLKISKQIHARNKKKYLNLIQNHNKPKYKNNQTVVVFICQIFWHIHNFLASLVVLQWGIFKITYQLIFFCLIVKKKTKHCSFKSMFYKRYLNDVFILSSPPEFNVLFQNHISSKHKNIKFTVENEQLSSLLIFDVKINNKRKRQMFYNCL